MLKYIWAISINDIVHNHVPEAVVHLHLQRPVLLLRSEVTLYTLCVAPSRDWIASELVTSMTLYDLVWVRKWEKRVDDRGRGRSVSRWSLWGTLHLSPMRPELGNQLSCPQRVFIMLHWGEPVQEQIMTQIDCRVNRLTDRLTDRQSF